MDIIEAMNMVRRIENLSEIHQASDKAVIRTVHRYFYELHEIEKNDEAYFQSESHDKDYALTSIENRKVIHKRFWANHSVFYEPCSLSSMHWYDWDKVAQVEIQRNDDDENQLFLFIAKYNMSDTAIMNRTYLLKQYDKALLIEHEFR